MTPFAKQITCPYCFERFEAAQAKYRCVNPVCSKRAEDIIFARSRGLIPPYQHMGRVLPPKETNWRAMIRRPNFSVRCDTCAKETNKRLCPHCHFELSHDAGLIDDYIIAIIGGRDTGKGHYIATLINRLEQETGAQFQFALRMLGDDTRQRFEEDYRTPLFRQRRKLEGTVSAIVDPTVKQPMIFRLTFKSGRHSRAVNLSFFDSAGEDMLSLDTLSVEARYICEAAGIIFLLDPLQIEAVRQRVSPEILPRQEPLAEPAYIVSRLRELFERRYRLAATTKVTTPVAFVLSKVDTLLPLIDAGSALHLTGNHFGHFNLSDAQSIHTEIWNYLQSWMGAGFSNVVEADFARFHYFGVSSLGRSPDKSGKIETISPIRVEDPFLWILHQIGLIKGRKDGSS